VCRHPDDCAAIARAPEAFPKYHPSHSVRAWLGQGLVSTEDVGLHDAMKEVLLPAFRAAAVKGFAPLFARVGGGAGGAATEAAASAWAGRLQQRRRAPCLFWVWPATTGASRVASRLMTHAPLP
jgi:hypothetical protein